MRPLTKCAMYAAAAVAVASTVAPAVANAAWSNTATGHGYAHGATVAAPTLATPSVTCSNGTGGNIVLTLHWTVSDTTGVNTQYAYGHVPSATAPTSWSSPTTISNNTATQFADAQFNGANSTKYWLAVQAGIQNANGAWKSSIVSGSYTTASNGKC